MSIIKIPIICTYVVCHMNNKVKEDEASKRMRISCTDPSCQNRLSCGKVGEVFIHPF